MKYKIVFELPDNETVLSKINTAQVEWAVWGYSGCAHAEPERKGEWIINEEEKSTASGSCSVCGWQAHLYEDDVVGMNFCPHCGAKMEDGQ